MKDELGNRMKMFYENRTRYMLPRKTYTIIRIDGKAFHTYTRGLNRPFDNGFIADMDKTMMYLCQNIQGAKIGYVQSDEISILLTDFDELNTDMWFDGNLQKICSVSASMATAYFNKLRLLRASEEKPDKWGYDVVIDNNFAHFDARVFQIGNPIEVQNYFVWRQKDATRNSISSVAQSLYSPKQLHGKSTNQMQEMVFQKNINWNDYSVREKRGGLIFRSKIELMDENGIHGWINTGCPIFTEDPEFLRKMIPKWE